MLDNSIAFQSMNIDSMEANHRKERRVSVISISSEEPSPRSNKRAINRQKARRASVISISSEDSSPRPTKRSRISSPTSKYGPKKMDPISSGDNQKFGDSDDGDMLGATELAELLRSWVQCGIDMAIRGEVYCARPQQQPQEPSSQFQRNLPQGHSSPHPGPPYHYAVPPSQVHYGSSYAQASQPMTYSHSPYPHSYAQQAQPYPHPPPCPSPPHYPGVSAPKTDPAGPLPNYQVLGPISNNANITHVQIDPKGPKPPVLPPDAYLSFYGLESMYGTTKERDYVGKEGFSEGRKRWLSKLGLNLPPYNTVWTAQDKREEVEANWARQPAATRQLIEMKAIHVKYMATVHAPLRKPPAVMTSSERARVAS